MVSVKVRAACRAAQNRGLTALASDGCWGVAVCVTRARVRLSGAPRASLWRQWVWSLDGKTYQIELRHGRKSGIRK
eukprot:5141278-Prymnesium_polylepis.2